MEAPRRGPLSIEELLRKKKQQEEESKRPKFLSKKERDELARARMNQAAAAPAPAAAPPRTTEPIGTNGRSADGAGAPGRDRRDDREKRDSRRDDRRGDRRDDRREDRRDDRDRRDSRRDDREPKADVKDGPDAEAKLLKERYMGIVTHERRQKRRRLGDKKFTFDWNADDDTSSDFDPIYRNDVSTDLTLKKAASDEEVRRRTRELQAPSRKSMNYDNMHWSEKPLEMMRERDWRIFKEDFSISTKGGSVPNPIRSWAESGLPPEILATIKEVGYEQPSAIQRAAIPIALSCRDVIGVAETGSGKTASFVLPLLAYISELPVLNDITKADGPYALVLAPTRELAQQIESEARKFATPLGFRCVSIVGGHTIAEQSMNLQNGAEIVIATPGRLVDCLERRVLVLSQCCYLIMDEADRMVDMGFEEQVNKILEALPVSNLKPDTDDAEDARLMSNFLGKDRYRQTMMYTATMPTAIERIARQYLRRPATVIIGTAGQAVDTVEQRVEFVANEEKRRRRMLEIMGSGHKPPIIVFVNLKRNCDYVSRELNKAGWKSVILHGGKSQDQREHALAQLRNGEADVLVATDLAGRGIDVPDVGLVLNFNMAKNIEDYTHRIGRTGRAGKSGVAISFLTNEDQDTFYDLKQLMSKSSLSRIPEELRRHPAAQAKPQARKNIQ
ncbi:P-loop containing nucleoside triphosphate hydrolase protein [Dipodascopsis tothii]|uniref:P-loop containing nucleoside triphosphate hydrolase protein n=1 Tax=Dipodascopsis tothii TaxID=44089 RepID=UPI0034CD475A